MAKAIHFPCAYPGFDTEPADATLYRLEQNASLERINPEIRTKITKLRLKLHLLEIVPAVLTNPNLVSRNVFVDSTGALIGVIDFEAAETQGFGSDIFDLYECFFGNMEDGVWSPYDMPDGDQYPDKSIHDGLAAAFWDTLVANVAPV